VPLELGTPLLPCWIQTPHTGAPRWGNLNPAGRGLAYSERGSVFPGPNNPDLFQKDLTMTSLIQTLSGTSSVSSRRAFMGRTGTLSAVAVALLAGQDAMAQGMAGDTSKDVGILNVALGLEHEAINAYQLGAGSGLLQKPVLDVAVRFQADHKAHRDALIATIQKLGGTPVMEKKLDDYAKALKADTLRNQGDVLDLASRLELGAINAYIGVIPAFGSKDLAKVAARLAADETMHYTLLQNALGRPLPATALSFGA
jgi:rubrerythrin